METSSRKDEKFFLNELYSAVLERTIKRLWVLCLILVILLVATNALWLYYEHQFETVRVEQDSGADGTNNFIGEDGTIVNGETDDNL